MGQTGHSVLKRFKQYHLSYQFNKQTSNFLTILTRQGTNFRTPTTLLLQGGIALTSPPCNKKQTSGLTEKGPVRLSNTCCEMGVVKAAS